MNDASTAALYYRLDGRRAHRFILLTPGRGAAALVDSPESREQLVRTVLTWLPTRAEPTSVENGRQVFVQATGTLRNLYSVEATSEGLNVRSASSTEAEGASWNWGFDTLTYARIAWPSPIDLAQASEAELRLLPGITAARARRIVEHRATTGLLTVETLRAIPGIGPKVCAGLTPWVANRSG